MNRLSYFLFIPLLWSFACQKQASKQNPGNTPQLHIEKEGESLSIYKGEQVLVKQEAQADFRPFLHPIHAPDGKGILTEYSPGHHKHQTGLYWGFTRVNGDVVDPDTILKTFYSREKSAAQQAMVGRDFFHHPGGEFWKRVDFKILEGKGEEVRWKTSYHMLDEKGEAMIKEHQTWSASVQEGMTILDLNWEGEAMRDIRVGSFGYGGLFLRMPWRKGIQGAAVNSAGQKNEEAESQKAKWVDVGMEIEDREDWGHIVMMDHPENANHPTPWRVDGQLGVGPCRAIEGDWTIEKGKTERMRFRLLIYTGEMSTDMVEKKWSELGS